MAVFISVVTSPFEDVFNEASRESRAIRNVRRPFRGIELKRDTYATIKVLDALNRPVLFVDSSAPADEGASDENGRVTRLDSGVIGMSTEYSNFILQSVQEQRVEKQQIVETFGEDYIFFFGERPRIYTFNAILLNTRNFNWKSEWWKNYEDILRGTRLLERNARMYIYFDDIVMEGYMLQAQAMATVEDPYKLPLQFQVFCTNYSIIGDVGSIFTPDYGAGPDSRVASSSPTVAVPDEDVRAADATSTVGSQNSLTGFLADASRFFNDASFTVQRALETMKLTFYGRSLAFSGTGSGNQLYVPPIENQASFPTAPGARMVDGVMRRVPIYEQLDEYTAYYESTHTPEYDQNELQRVRELLRLRSPQELDRLANAQLLKLGCRVGRPSAEYLLLGRAAFAGAQTFGSFGIRQADGTLDYAAGVDGLSEGVAALLGG